VALHRLFLSFHIVHVLLDLLSDLNVLVINGLGEPFLGVLEKLDTIEG
jgi:hypothetical protein